jgi:transcriptional regulator with XRE-family HTH domain
MTDLRLSQVLRAVRSATGLSQKDAADAAAAAGFPLRMDADAWSKFEREVREPTFEAARVLLGAVGVRLRFVDPEGRDLGDAIESWLGVDR